MTTTTTDHLTFFRFPDLDARIGLAIKGRRLAISFLAAGTSRSSDGEGGFAYRRRNPDKRAAQERLLRTLKAVSDAGLVLDATRVLLVGQVLSVRFGASTNLVEHSPAYDLVGKMAKAGGNYRLDLAIEKGPGVVGGVDGLGALFGLVPTDNRPVAARWLR
mgnify:CR=1 FL=1